MTCFDDVKNVSESFFHGQASCYFTKPIDLRAMGHTRGVWRQGRIGRADQRRVIAPSLAKNTVPAGGGPAAGRAARALEDPYSAL